MEYFEMTKQEALLGLQMEMEGVFKTKRTWQKMNDTCNLWKWDHFPFSWVA
jgi:hypothetical protein